MNHKLFFILLYSISSLSNAGTLGDALRIVCNPMTSRPDFHTCAYALKGHSYFEIRPLEICASLSQNTDKSECIKIIGDITYDQEETKTCSEKLTDDQKLKCLIQLGHNYFPEP